jgi:hypothetical protein
MLLDITYDTRRDHHLSVKWVAQNEGVGANKNTRFVCVDDQKVEEEAEEGLLKAEYILPRLCPRKRLR